ncbi:MAG: serine protease [Sandaracinaceae bacterium]|nr:serine protease [Sandaracinaceae bacterium]
MSTREWGLGLVMLAVSFGARAAHAQEIATDAASSEQVATAPSETPALLRVATTGPQVETSRGVGCGEAAHTQAGASVVRVESGTAVGSGFVALDASHVVTSFRLVRDGHGTRVVDHEGNARSARVVVTAPDDDLALLVLASPLDVAPLALAEPESLAVGMPILAIGHPYVRGRDRLALGLRGEGLFEQSLSAGVVSALGPRSLSTDAQLASGSVGGPIVDCEGHVVGVVSIATVGMMERIYVGASTVAIDDLASRASSDEGYGGRISFTWGLGIATAFEDPGWPMGAWGLLGLDVYDVFVLAARLHYLRGEDNPTGSEVLSTLDQRYRGDAFVAWRQLVTFGPGMGFHFELGAGASVTSLEQRTRAGTIDDTGTAPVLRITETSRQRWAVRPMVVLNVEVGPLMIGYTVELDIDTALSRYHVQHLFDLGVRF